jgi:hypothetical protein
MIERYTIRSGLAVSQKELERFHKVNSPIEFLWDIEGVKKVLVTVNLFVVLNDYISKRCSMA